MQTFRDRGGINQVAFADEAGDVGVDVCDGTWLQALNWNCASACVQDVAGGNAGHSVNLMVHRSSILWK